MSLNLQPIVGVEKALLIYSNYYTMKKHIKIHFIILVYCVSKTLAWKLIMWNRFGILFLDKY